MANWKKVIVSGSNAELAELTLSNLSTQATENTVLTEPTDSQVDEYIDDINEPIKIAGSTFYASSILKEMLEQAYEDVRADLVEEVIEYSCDECGCEYDNEFDAECCCDVDFEEIY